MGGRGSKDSSSSSSSSSPGPRLYLAPALAAPPPLLYLAPAAPLPPSPCYPAPAPAAPPPRPFPCYPAPAPAAPPPRPFPCYPAPAPAAPPRPFPSPPRPFPCYPAPAPAAPPRPPSPLLREPWRKIPWGHNEKDLQYVTEYETENKDVKHLRILLYGPVGAGKSSFINSVGTVVRHRICTPALVCTGSKTSFTKKYETHRIRKGKGQSKTCFPFVFNDIMGLEEDTGYGARPEDIRLALRGQVKDGYKFNPVSPLTEKDSDYNPSPSPEDKVHVLVCVLSANNPDIDISILEKMAEIREAASDLGIPQMAVITNIDTSCGEVEDNLQNVYKSKYIQQKLKELETIVGIPMNCIFPVKNYCDEIDLNDDVDSLILSALKKMIDFGDDFINKV